LGLHRGFFDLATAQRAAQWQTLLQRRADEVPIVVLGRGQMGRTVADRLSTNGYRVTSWSGEPPLAQVLNDAEIVINLLPLTAATSGLFDRATLAAMRPGA